MVNTSGAGPASPEWGSGPGLTSLDPPRGPRERLPVSEVGALEDRVGAALAVSELAGTSAPRLDHRYRLTRILGRGANGVVVAAHDERLDRQVALKLFAQWDERVLREARSIAKLDHPNVIRVHDVGVGDLQVEAERPVSCAYLCMALVPGKSLRAWLAEDKPSASRIRAVLAAAGEGLAAAHSAGLVHRDVKPENIMVGPGDKALVVDFGLARPPPEEGVLATLAGTPPYMAPEARAGRVSAAADVYAFARVTVEALSGALPTDERGLEAVLADLGKRLRRALRRALDPDPRRRGEIPAIVRALHRPRATMVWSLLLAAIFAFSASHLSPEFRGWFYGLFEGHDSAAQPKPPPPPMLGECTQSAGTWTLDTHVDALGLARRGLGAQGMYSLTLTPECEVTDFSKTRWRNYSDDDWQPVRPGPVQGKRTRTRAVAPGTIEVQSDFNGAPHQFTLRLEDDRARGTFERRESEPPGSVVWNGTVGGYRGPWTDPRRKIGSP